MNSINSINSNKFLAQYFNFRCTLIYYIFSKLFHSLTTQFNNLSKDIPGSRYTMKRGGKGNKINPGALHGVSRIMKFISGV